MYWIKLQRNARPISVWLIVRDSRAQEQQWGSEICLQESIQSPDSGFKQMCKKHSNAHKGWLLSLFCNDYRLLQETAPDLSVFLNASFPPWALYFA